MVTKRWKRSHKSVYNLGYHLIWCPKYRRSILRDTIESRLKELLHQKAQELDISIEKMEIMPDHVHLFVKTSPVESPHWVIGQFKGYTSNILRKEFPKLSSSLPSLWTRSYYCESVGNISEETVKKYIQNQKNK